MKKVAGLRITDDNTLMVAKSVLGRINDCVVVSSAQAGLKAIGLAGSECGHIVAARWTRSRIEGPDGAEVGGPGSRGRGGLGRSPVGRMLCAGMGFVPVIYSICADEEGI